MLTRPHSSVVSRSPSSDRQLPSRNEDETMFKTAFGFVDTNLTLAIDVERAVERCNMTGNRTSLNMLIERMMPTCRRPVSLMFTIQFSALA